MPIWGGSEITGCTVKDLTVNVTGDVINVGGLVGEPDSESVFDGNTVESITVEVTGSLRNFGGLLGCIWRDSVNLTNNSVKSISLLGAVNNAGAYIGEKNSIGTEEGNTKGESLNSLPDYGKLYENGVVVETHPYDSRTPQNVDVDLSTLTQVTITADSLTYEGLNAWAVEADAHFLYDGKIGIASSEERTTDEEKGTKIGGGTAGTVTITFSADGVFNYYTFYTGFDCAKENGRNPRAWTLYGLDQNNQWVELDKVTGSSTTSTGMLDVNCTPYTYSVDSPAEYSQYKFELTVGGTFQMNEIELYYGETANPEPPTTNEPTTNEPTTNAPTTNAPTTNAPTTNAGSTGGDTTSPKTGDVTTIAVGLAVVALAGIAIVSKKIRITE